MKVKIGAEELRGPFEVKFHSPDSVTLKRVTTVDVQLFPTFGYKAKEQIPGLSAGIPAT